jgi:endonuclease G, mitochondrial
MKLDRSRQHGYLLLSAVSLCLILPSCRWFSPPRVDNVNLLLGNPSGAAPNTGSSRNYLMVRPQYVMSYNRDKGTPNWASWQLNSSWLGTLPRTQFTVDPSLPQSWYQVKPEDYTGSGFDRGHVVPAADRDRTDADRQSVFVMTNILPQAPNNNRGAWEKLESDCRELVGQGKELYILAGGTGSGGAGDRGSQTSIAQGRVAVPASTWKIVVVLNRPGLGLKGITNATRVIAVNIPNRQRIRADWQHYRTSVDRLEMLTGYDFLSNVPASTQATIESRIDNQ